MKKFAVMTSLMALACGAMAQEVARVISSTPIVAQVVVPQKVCTQQQVEVKENKGGVGGLAGMAIGGAIGNRFGDGDGRALSTVIGALGGALIGDKLDNKGQTSRIENVQSCHVQNFVENRTTGYNVVYEFAGRQYTTQMATDPGPTIKIQITPIASSPVNVVTTPTVTTIQSAPAPVIIYQRTFTPAPVYYVKPRNKHHHDEVIWKRDYF